MKLTLGAAHEIGFATAMTMSIIIVLLGGELPAFAWLVCLAPWVSVILAMRRIEPPALSATLVGVTSIALAGVTLARGGLESSVLAGGELLILLLQLLLEEDSTLLRLRDGYAAEQFLQFFDMSIGQLRGKLGVFVVCLNGDKAFFAAARTGIRL